jgi:hypothetical protein
MGLVHRQRTQTDVETTRDQSKGNHQSETIQLAVGNRRHPKENGVDGWGAYVEGRDVVTLAVLRGDFDDRDDLERSCTDAVTRCHLGVEGSDSVGLGQLTVLAVHVVSSRARVVPQTV